MHPTLRVHKRTWAKEISTMVYFSSGPVDLDLPTVQLHDPKPDWHWTDLRQSSFVFLIMRWLRAMFPHARGFVHPDDDVYPILPNIHAKLDEFQCRNGGDLPYISPHGSGGGCNPYYEEQRELTARKCKPGGPFMQGNLMTFNRSLLALMADAADIDKCPVTNPGDQATGMLIQCGGGLKDWDSSRQVSWRISYYEWDGRDPHPNNPWKNSPLAAHSSANDWLAYDAYHHLRAAQDVELTDRLFRAAFARSGQAWP